VKKDQAGVGPVFTEGVFQPRQGLIRPGKMQAWPLGRRLGLHPMGRTDDDRPMGNGRRKTEKVAFHHNFLTSSERVALLRRANRKVIYQYMQTNNPELSGRGKIRGRP
jgi:hypothetical protein